jgi:phenylacetate-CoA ligase
MMRCFHRHLLLPAFESVLKRRKTLRYWDELERTQWLSQAAVEAIRFAALARLLAHAYEHCPYYKQAWDGLGLHPRRLGSPSDFHLWPVIGRDEIREHRPAMRTAQPARRLITKATGGSSGVPLQFDLDPESHERRTAAAHRGYNWAGAGPGTKQLHLWGATAGPAPFRRRVKDYLYHALHRRRVMSSLDAGDDLAVRFAATLDRYRPDAVVAYTNPLYEVARRLEESGAPAPFTPKSIVVGAEKLHPFQRTQIERVFRAPVFETYGSREFMLIAAECEHHRGLHLTAEQLLVEVLDDAGRPSPAGEEGNVVITDLYNYGMPFVRYANGDRAVAGAGMESAPGVCPCGRGLPLLDRVVGRRLDVLHGTDGRLIPGEFFPHLVKDFPAVRRFQVVQEEAGRVRFALDAVGLSEDERAVLERLVRNAMGPGVRVDFEPVARIPLTATGKLQVVLNRVPLRRAG